MDLHQHVEELQRQLSLAAQAGDEDSRGLARRLTGPLDASARLVLLTALSEAAGEISAELAPGSVEIRLRGGAPEFVVTPPPAADAPLPAEENAAPGRGDRPASAPNEPPAAMEADAASTTRTTLRLPDHLKNRVESAAAQDGVSVNTWLVRAVAAALERPTPRAAPRDTPRRSTGRMSGWVR